MRILFCLVLLFSQAYAQSFYFPTDSAVVRSIELPKSQPFDSAHPYQKTKGNLIYIISSKDAYDLFGYAKGAEFQNFNFLEQHIIGSYICTFCIEVCYYNGSSIPCHRNACSYEWVWAIRDNKKAFTSVEVMVKPNFSAERRYFRDTVLYSGDTANWYTVGHGDCFAHFKYELLKDNYRPSLILKEYNYWGGCRAGGSKPAVISFLEPGLITYRVKRTVLMKKKELEF